MFFLPVIPCPDLFMHATILARLFYIVEEGIVTCVLYEGDASVAPGTSNQVIRKLYFVALELHTGVCIVLTCWIAGLNSPQHKAKHLSRSLQQVLQPVSQSHQQEANHPLRNVLCHYFWEQGLFALSMLGCAFAFEARLDMNTAVLLGNGCICVGICLRHGKNNLV